MWFGKYVLTGDGNFSGWKLRTSRDLIISGWCRGRLMSLLERNRMTAFFNFILLLSYCFKVLSTQLSPLSLFSYYHQRVNTFYYLFSFYSLSLTPHYKTVLFFSSCESRLHFIIWSSDFSMFLSFLKGEHSALHMTKAGLVFGTMPQSFWCFRAENKDLVCVSVSAECWPQSIHRYQLPSRAGSVSGVISESAAFPPGRIVNEFDVRWAPVSVHVSPSTNQSWDCNLMQGENKDLLLKRSEGSPGSCRKEARCSRP